MFPLNYSFKWSYDLRKLHETYNSLYENSVDFVTEGGDDFNVPLRERVILSHSVFKEPWCISPTFGTTPTATQ